VTSQGSQVSDPFIDKCFDQTTFFRLVVETPGVVQQIQVVASYPELQRNADS